ncbi:MAG: orotate phosphoribosyltransferase [Ignavibacteria bacterium GWA2_55_11]|nr:MAG: orotate phosphoribosyltransferase [Ignavibacteria bacterium GWA2_55_11]OGU44238.1 MAG: orotate phosphoribosyltransferase [Ignavibacteria bacterium GWC2_56_12]OGU62286.1 MAG: orotate phosphoribosyltransferase [Ignavibacteria bacterium RIFCSPHIGHO2_02_FULL_56_12]OGU75774.1 MAG: orotate phosphoribosyltransferase [Ignavibacteria bacterium RIFCSPLOWO2_02_FULL_55_14]OGU76867.1 MAG: orotate phosphoribosyltransferase [Ignavibacteria bacterium RIFCSPLOWO2_12_FULL_56_21]HAV23162.1 orotate phosph
MLEIFKDSGALLEGHFQLTSGLHSPHYFQCAKVLQYPKFLHLFAGEIAKHFEYSEIEVVISPAIGGIVVGTEVGRVLGCRTIFAERKDSTMQIRRGFELRQGERVLVVEDVVTTGGSVFEVMDIVKGSGARTAGVGYIVDRSNGKVRFDAKQASILQMDVVTYQPADCPLCRAGGAAVKPGSRGNT